MNYGLEFQKTVPAQQGISISGLLEGDYKHGTCVFFLGCLGLVGSGGVGRIPAHGEPIDTLGNIFQEPPRGSHKAITLRVHVPNNWVLGIWVIVSRV